MSRQDHAEIEQIIKRAREVEDDLINSGRYSPRKTKTPGYRLSQYTIAKEMGITRTVLNDVFRYFKALETYPELEGFSKTTVLDMYAQLNREKKTRFKKPNVLDKKYEGDGTAGFYELYHALEKAVSPLSGFRDELQYIINNKIAIPDAYVPFFMPLLVATFDWGALLVSVLANRRTVNESGEDIVSDDND